MNNKLPIRLQIPRPTLSECRAFALDADAARAWSDCLPVADAQRAAGVLHEALDELTRAHAEAALRFDILEALRPNLLVILTNLSRHFCGRQRLPAARQQALAELSDGLCRLATSGYTQVAVHTIQQGAQAVQPARLVCEALQRALHLTGLRILQALQLNQPLEQGLWLNLHQLYALAERQRLPTLPVSDPSSGSGTIAATYCQALILGCAKPNQLRASDLAAIYHGMRGWSRYLELGDPGSEGLFLIDLGADEPPAYAGSHNGAHGAGHRHLHTSALLQHLQSVREQCRRQGRPGVQFDEHFGIPCNILDHLIMTLSSRSSRSHGRTRARRDIFAVEGLPGIHYRVAGERCFEQLLYGRPDAVSDADYRGFIHTDQISEPGLQGSGYIVIDGIDRDDPATAEYRYPVHRVEMFNASPAGYGLSWTGGQLPELHSSSLIAVRERQEAPWAIAVVRWVNQSRDGSGEAGVELLSPAAQAYGALVHQASAPATDPLRALLLPEIGLVGQPHTLLLPHPGLREMQKLTLLRDGEEFLVQLTRRLSAGGSFAQYEFRYIKQLEAVLAEDHIGPEAFAYDSIWSNI